MSISEYAVEFNRIEAEIFRACCKQGREALKAVLEAWDTKLAESRERSKYRHKGYRKTTIKTIRGEMEYRRSIYEVREEGAQKRFIYLLDEAMGKEGVGTISSLLAEKIIEASCESTFRAAARSVSEMSGQSISHTAAWNVVQAMGRKLDAEERQAGKEAAENEGAGELETKVLFEEQDGIWMHLQGKSRKKHGKSKEMKLAIAYDGAQKIGKKRYELTNKVACANFEEVGKFVRRKEGVIARVYNTDEIEMRFLNGDGAAWIRQSQTDESVHFQLDPFHRNKAILANVKNPEAREQIMELLYAGNIDHLMVYLEALTNSVEDEEEKEHITELWKYFSNNKDGLLPINRQAAGAARRQGIPWHGRDGEQYFHHSGQSNERPPRLLEH